MIRSYTLALVLVWLRVMYDFQDEEMRDATREWASWVIPLLAVELWVSSLPQMRTKRTIKPASLRGTA